jgi:hypothetical protein
MVSWRTALAFLLFLSGAAAAQQRVAVVLNGDRVLVVLPGTILKERAVRARLDSALTTIFIVKSRIRGDAAEKINRIEVRYDLWDSVYRVQRASQQQIVQPAQLEAWWRTPIEIGRLTPMHAVIEIDLIVLPFSAAEERDAREWLSKSGGARDPSASSKGVIGILVGTTLSARPVVSYHWAEEIVRR